MDLTLGARQDSRRALAIGPANAGHVQRLTLQQLTVIVILARVRRRWPTRHGCQQLRIGVRQGDQLHIR
jgi:hypothetical protein